MTDTWAISLWSVAGASAPAAQVVELTATRPSTLFTATASVPWLRVVKEKEATPTTIGIFADASGLSAGVYLGKVIVTGQGNILRPCTITVRFTVAAPLIDH